MNFKYSQFNMIDEIAPNICSIYNSKFGRHIVLKFDDKVQKEIMLSGNKCIGLLAPHTREKMERCEFIIAADHDEFAELEALNRKDQEEKYSGLILSILPTLLCNFYCPYCFEDSTATSSNCYMNEQTQDNVVKFVEQKLAAGIKNGVTVKWFGGEPLLADEIITDLSEKLKKTANAFGNNYNSIIITNGYYLDKLTEEKIKIMSLTGAQITLDGAEEIHNQRRVAKSGQKTFKRIIENIKKISEYFNGITIRINADKTNAESIPKLYKYLLDEGILKKCNYVYIAYVDTELGRYSVESQCASLLNGMDIKEIYATISKGLADEGIEDAEFLLHPKFLSVTCDAQIKNYFVIDPEGYVFKCGSDATIRDRSLFNLNTGKEINPQRGEDFLKFNPLNHPECRTCAQLPVCRGGCPAKYLNIKSKEPFCWSFCHDMRQRLVKIAKRSMK